jgi:hypothetical protein
MKTRVHCAEATVPGVRSLAGLFALLVGCSAIGVVPPNAPDLACTRSRTTPTLDVVGAVTTAALAGVATVGSLACCRDTDGSPVIGILVLGMPLALLSTAYIASSHYGFKQTRACRAL